MVPLHYLREQVPQGMAPVPTAELCVHMAITAQARPCAGTPTAIVPAHGGHPVAARWFVGPSSSRAMHAGNWDLISTSWSRYQGDAEPDVPGLLLRRVLEPLGPAHQGQEASHSCCQWLCCERPPPLSLSEVFTELCFHM